MSMFQLGGNGKSPFSAFTKSALVDMLEQAVTVERDRALPMHKRGKKSTEKDEATEDADEERKKLADLAEEQKGSPAPVEMDDEDMSDEAMEEIESRAPKKKTAKKKK